MNLERLIRDPEKTWSRVLTQVFFSYLLPVSLVGVCNPGLIDKRRQSAGRFLNELKALFARKPVEYELALEPMATAF
jgi:hypothetical protein